MITMTVVRNDAGDMVSFSVKGHAGTAPRGQDIVCAGVSALTQAALLGLKEHLQREFRWKAEQGDMAMELSGHPDALTNAILETMMLGLYEIAKLYPKYLRISENIKRN